MTIESRLSRVPALLKPRVITYLDADACLSASRQAEPLIDGRPIAGIRELDTNALNADDVRNWLRPLPFHGPVIVLWLDCGNAISIAFEKFVEYYDDLWYPSSDDVVVLQNDNPLALLMDHEEMFSLVSLSSAPA